MQIQSKHIYRITCPKNLAVTHIALGFLDVHVKHYF